MSDLIGVNDTLPVRLGGVSSTSGLPDNYADVNVGGSLQVAGQGVAGTPAGGVVSVQGVSGGSAVAVSQSTTPWITQDLADGSVTGGTAGTYSQLTGGQYNSTLPTLTTGQQSAIQVDSHGRILTVSSNFPLAVDTNYGTVGANTLRTASQIGNATGAANFGAGATGAQTLRVAANTYDGSGNAINSQTLSSNQWLDVVIPSIGPVSPGTVASFSDLVGGQYNSTQPTLTNTQQSALQLDALGNLRATLPDRQVTGTLGALNATITLSNLNGMSSGALELDGSFSGTVLVEGASGSTQYCTIALYDISLGYMTAINFTGATVQGNYQLIGVGSYTTIKATVSAYTSGSLTATLTLSSGIDLLNVVSPYAPNFNAQVVGNVASGTADSGNGVKVSGIYNSSAPTFVSGNRADLQTDLNGNLKITGTVTSTNTSIGQVNTTPPSFATYIGAYASTSPPTWGNGDLAPLSVENVGGYLRTADSSDGPVTAGTAATTSMLAGGQYNTTLPTLTTGQQAALQVDSGGRLLVAANVSNFPNPVDTNYGTVGSNTTRTAAQIGNATGAADFNAGATGAQTLRVSANQGTSPWIIEGDSASGAAKAGNPVQIGGVFNTTQPTVTTGQTVEAQSTARGALIVATGVDTFTVTANAGTNLNTSALALDTSVNGILVAQGTTTSGEKGPLIQGAVTTAAPTYTTGDTNPLSLTTSGALRVEAAVGGTLTDNSGTTSATINTSTQIMAANTARKYLFVQNVGASTIWINFTTAANANEPSIQLIAGASFVMEGSFVSTEVVNVASAVASIKYTAKQA